MFGQIHSLSPARRVRARTDLAVAALAFASLLAAALGGCKETNEPRRSEDSLGASLAPSPGAPAASAHNDQEPRNDAKHVPEGDAAHGKTLVEKFECSRCHAVQDHEPAPQAKHCVQCHDDISKGRFKAPASALSRWQKTVDDYTVTPSLHALGTRFEPEWLYAFLKNPVDLRPQLTQSMPRLELTDKEASDLVAYLSTLGTTERATEASAAQNGNAANGRKLMDQKSCSTCHAFSGVPPFSTKTDIGATDEQQKRAVRLAPDLRFTRERFKQSAVVAWLMDPKSIKADTLMPSHGLTKNDAIDISAYLYTAELEALPAKPIPERLPVLERRVGFQEVMDKVFGVTCRHCHSDPDAALGDGGPGNSGGFGFKPKGLDLATYRGVAAGYLDEKGERQSIFAELKDGTPRLLATVLARQQEEAGQRHTTVRGMPLGLPALTPEQVQLVESWIAQGRPR